MKLLQQKLTSAGGSNSFNDHHVSRNEGVVRKFSTPVDSNEFKDYKDHFIHDEKIVLFDIYCDGLNVPSSGTQSVSPARIRYPNVKTITSTWFDIGIVPIIEVEQLQQSQPSKLSELRLELFQLYIFIVCEELMLASLSGFYYQSIMLFLHLNMISCDQKQERQFLYLFGARTFRASTPCVKPFRDKTANTAIRHSESLSCHDDSDNSEVEMSVNGNDIYESHPDIRSSQNAVHNQSTRNLQRSRIPAQNLMYMIRCIRSYYFRYVRYKHIIIVPQQIHDFL